MPVLANAKQELYCKHRSNNFIPRKAAIAAGYATGSAIYTELEADPVIVNRIAELMEENRERKEARAAFARASAETAGAITGVGHAWVIEQLKLNAEDARDAGDFKESNAAIKLIGEHIGMWGAGGGPADKPGNSERTDSFSLDDLERLTNATDHLAAPSEERVVDVEVVLGLIEGHKTPARRSDPKLATGSETDVAMTMGDDDEIADAEFEETTP